MSARRVTGFWCGQPTTSYNHPCGEVARFVVVVPGEPGVTSSCAQHLAKAVTAETTRHGTTGVVVKPLPYKEPRKENAP